MRRRNPEARHRGPSFSWTTPEKSDRNKAPENSRANGHLQRDRLTFTLEFMSNPTPSRRDGEATRQRLLRAALDLYTTVGFRATTTPAIAARAGVAEGTIYRHFSGKEHLLNEVYRNAQRWGAGLVKEAEPNGHHSVSERLGGIAPATARRRGPGSRRSPACCSGAGTSSTSTSAAGRRRANSGSRCRQVVAGGET